MKQNERENFSFWLNGVEWVWIVSAAPSIEFMNEFKLRGEGYMFLAHLSLNLIPTPFTH